MIKELKELITTTNPNYTVYFEESAMMNIAVDEISNENSFAYIEEYTESKYFKQGYSKKKSTRVQIYFCKFSELHNNAECRESSRQRIESEIVKPFIESYNKSGLFINIDTWVCRAALPRFDANEVSLMLEFDLIQNIC